jgi:RNA polymerase sigma factor (sigma-70 family)
VQDDGSVDTDLLGVPASDRVLHSDPHDFAGLYIRHRASFTMHARRYLRDGRDADEVVQEAFLRLFLALPELETELQALAYCRRTITNLCIDRYRAQARRPSLVDLDSANALDLAEDDPGDPVVRAEDAAMVRAALSLLSPLHRAALVKREIEEKPLPVIAEELDIPEESVKHVLFRARRALRRILASTSLAPGNDAEIAGALGKAVRSSSGGVAAFVLLLFLGLSTGPDLRAIPVVGSDLPDLLPVTEIASAVGGAVTSVAEGVASVVKSGSDEGGTDSGATLDSPDALPLPVASPSPSAGPASVEAPPKTVDEVVASPAPTATPTAPSVTPTAQPTAAPSGEPSPDPAGTRAPSPESESEPEPEAPASPKPASTSSPAPTASSSSEPRKNGKSSKAAPGASTSPSPSPSPTQTTDPEAYKTDGLEYVYDVNTGEMVLVPIGQTIDSWRV